MAKSVQQSFRLSASTTDLLDREADASNESRNASACRRIIQAAVDYYAEFRDEVDADTAEAERAEAGERLASGRRSPPRCRR